MALNVNTKVQDSFYRYKMPPIIAKVILSPFLQDSVRKFKIQH